MGLIKHIIFVRGFSIVGQKVENVAGILVHPPAVLLLPDLAHSTPRATPLGKPQMPLPHTMPHKMRG